MLKRNLIVIGIASLALIFASSALSQEPNLMGTKGNRPKPRAVRVATGDVTGDGFRRTRRRGTTTRGLVIHGTGGNDTLQKGLTKVGSGTMPLGLRRRFNRRRN